MLSSKQIARMLVAALVVFIAPFHLSAGQAETKASNQASDAHSSPVQPAGRFDGPAELPRIYIDSSLHATPAPGKTVVVRAGEDPSEAISQASCGDTIQLQAGATFDDLVLSAKKCDDSHWIIIRTSAPDAKLPPEGTRLTPCYAGVSSLPGRPALQCASTENVLAKIEFKARSGNGPVHFAPGANHYRLIGLEITRPESAAVIYNLAGPDRDKGAADHIFFDRVWVHGTTHNETVRGVMLSHVRYAAIVDSYFSDFHCIARTGICVDSQAIAGGSGDDPMGPFKIVNNFLEAAGENIIFGGAEATATPADIEVRHNHLFKPMTWMKGQPDFVGGADGSPFIVKNLFEIKNAQRVVFEGNILEHSWGGFSQTGYGILLTPKNQQTRTGSACPNCQVTDITIRNCTVSHVGSGLLMGNGATTNGGAAKDGGRYSIHDVVIDDIQDDFYNGFGTFAQISTETGDSAAPRLHDVAINHVTAFPSKSAFIIGGPRNDPRMSGISITNSIFTPGRMIVNTTGGGPEKNCAAMPHSKTVDVIFHECFSSFRFEHNVIIDGGGGWPKDNQTPKHAADVGFTNYADGKGGDYRLSKNSKFKDTTSDQKEPGADLDAIDQATKGVR
ncbi:MAG: hypothetical protein ABSF97_12240 [Candidatus Sulfotelmatobacter sp.]|jgi:hypothetical protein